MTPPDRSGTGSDDGSHDAKRKPWRTPVVILASANSAEAKGFTVGDYTSGGNPYGS